jgi:RHS repeat-associated protein
MDELTNGVVTRSYTYGLQRISEDQIVNGVWTPSFYGYDGGGSVRYLSNAAGTVTDTYEYDAFGNDVNHTGTTPNNYLYRGEQYDSDLGLYYLRARYYNPSASRFLSRDPEDGIPTDPKTLHKYVYAGGDPVNAMDPTGRDVALGYAQFTFWDAVKTTAKAVALSGAIDCVYEFITTKFDGTIQVAFDGGSITQVGPCVWLFANAQKALPQPVAPAQPIVGTRASPWPPQCDQLKQVVDNAKALAAGLGRCTPGMSPWQLQARYDAWIALGAARAQYNMVCWNGGDSGHQQADANAWLAAGQCAALKAAF